MKKTVIIILVVLVLLGGVWYWMSSNGSNNQPVACPADARQCPDGSYVGRVAPSCDFAPCAVVTGTTTPGTGTTTGSMEDGTVASTSVNVNVGVNVSQAKIVTVAYTDTGFTPNTITINKGDTVKFVNQSNGKMWVASNPHPTHTDYPGFDEKTAVDNGVSYSFTFTKVGSWGYHNHFNSSIKGTVVVK